MEPKEFRIGNYYEPTDDSGYFTEVTIKTLIAWEAGAIFGRLIPLTEDWLLKFGFMKDREDPRFYFKISKPLQYHNGYIVPIFFKPYAKPMGDQDDRYGEIICFMWGQYRELTPFRDRDLKYVHQLQNLYFALTGEELTIAKSI